MGKHDESDAYAGDILTVAGGTEAAGGTGNRRGAAGGAADELRLNAEELAQYLEAMTRGDGQLCLDKDQLVKDYKVYVWLVREVQAQKGVLQRVPQSAATGTDVVSHHAEALREFDANHVAWFQKSKLMALLYHRLLGARNAVAAARTQQQQQRRQQPGLVR